mmetsp:Transcript_27635/g.50019  ORF Transcript_27635/g.50019 Transcript_27635/m.50019 type:complete len:91 (+) Transcript_27635:381-653(+)
MAPINESLSRQGSSLDYRVSRFESKTIVQAEPISGFLFDWMEAISSQVKEQQVVCKDCIFVLVDRIPRQDFPWRAATCFVPNARPISVVK